MRFATARDVLLAYPQIAIAFQSRLDDTPSSAYVDKLVAQGQWADAIAFIAHLLPRREAVWWAAQCVRKEPKAFTIQEEPLVAAAEGWVREPSEANRKAALVLGDAANAMRAAVWVTRAAGWSGGVLYEVDDTKIMCQPHMSPAAARGAVMLAAAAASDPRAFLGGCVGDAKTLLGRLPVQ